MVYGYLRVSTDKQTVENQRFEIERFCVKNNIVIEKWIEETISGTKLPEKRLLGSLLAGIKKDDLIICAELSRLGRSLFMIMSILNHLMNVGARVWTIKDNYRLGDDIQSKVLAFAFSLSAEIERDLISQRIKEALARRKAEGKILGRPVGRKSSRVKLTGNEEKIIDLLNRKIGKSAIGRILGVNRMTVDAFMKNNGITAQPPPVFNLTGYAEEIEKMLIDGLSAIKISRRLGCSEYSVYKYLNEVYEGKHWNPEETRKKVKGWHHTEEMKQKMSEVRKGIKLSDETRRKMSEAKSGENNPNYGRPRTAEVREKISMTKKEKKIAMINQ